MKKRFETLWVLSNSRRFAVAALAMAAFAWIGSSAHAADHSCCLTESGAPGEAAGYAAVAVEEIPTEESSSAPIAVAPAAGGQTLAAPPRDCCHTAHSGQAGLLQELAAECGCRISDPGSAPSAPMPTGGDITPSNARPDAAMWVAHGHLGNPLAGVIDRRLVPDPSIDGAQLYLVNRTLRL